MFDKLFGPEFRIANERRLDLLTIKHQKQRPLTESEQEELKHVSAVVDEHIGRDMKPMLDSLEAIKKDLQERGIWVGED